ncbi:unnamed protein product, partial [Callosobruchus maculatus]
IFSNITLSVRTLFAWFHTLSQPCTYRVSRK